MKELDSIIKDYIMQVIIMSKKVKVGIYLLIVLGAFLLNFYYRPIEGNKLVKKDSHSTDIGLYDDGEQILLSCFYI